MSMQVNAPIIHPPAFPLLQSSMKAVAISRPCTDIPGSSEFSWSSGAQKLSTDTAAHLISILGEENVNGNSTQLLGARALWKLWQLGVERQWKPTFGSPPRTWLWCSTGLAISPENKRQLYKKIVILKKTQCCRAENGPTPTAFPKHVASCSGDSDGALGSWGKI